MKFKFCPKETSSALVSTASCTWVMVRLSCVWAGSFPHKQLCCSQLTRSGTPCQPLLKLAVHIGLTSSSSVNYVDITLAFLDSSHTLAPPSTSLEHVISEARRSRAYKPGLWGHWAGPWDWWLVRPVFSGDLVAPDLLARDWSWNPPSDKISRNRVVGIERSTLEGFISELTHIMK